MAEQQVVEQPVNQQQQESAQQSAPEVDYKKQFEELSGKYKEIESKYTEEVETARNMDSYFQQDTVAKQRAQLWLQAKGDQSQFNELLKTLDTSSAKPQKEVQQAPAFDEKKLEAMLEQKLQSRLDPVYTRNAELDQERSKAELFKSEPWMTNEKYAEFETKYGKKIEQIATGIFKSMGPFITQSERQAAADKAYSQAHGQFAHMTDQELVRVFMADDRDKFIAEGRRPAPRLPNGMVDNVNTGKAPELLKQLKQKYLSIEGNHQAVAKLCEEFAPQLGMDADQVHKLLD